MGDKGSYLYINFGAPVAHENNADRAAATALALMAQPEHHRYICTSPNRYQPGRMRAGAYGGSHHRTYGVLGNEVNMAARFMMAAKPGQILLSQAAQRSLSQAFVVEALPPIRVKGKDEPVDIFALRARNKSAAPVGGSHLHALPMIGRQAELAQVAERLALAAQGHGQMVGIVGEAGLGKSRLVAEVVRLAVDHGFATYGGECESYGLNEFAIWFGNRSGAEFMESKAVGRAPARSANWPIGCNRSIQRWAHAYHSWGQCSILRFPTTP
ncbi:MAG: adenylate/guanylate cyclase domain-containing protein [Caldilineaceae bacterium]